MGQQEVFTPPSGVLSHRFGEPPRDLFAGCGVVINPRTFQCFHRGVATDAPTIGEQLEIVQALREFHDFF